MNRTYWNAVLLSLGVASTVFTVSQKAEAALDEKYLRNGECYMLIGEGGFKGIYRLNNPAAGIDSVNQLVIPGTSFEKKDTKGFAVDLDRHIYTFTERVAETGGEDGRGFSRKSGNIYRQVLDNSVSDDTSDYGSWSYFHTDSRTRGKGSNIYRSNNTSNPTRNIRNSSSIKSLGPGTPVTKPAGYKLPVFKNRPNSESDLMTLAEYPGRSWYRIPNGAWFSSWHKNNRYPGYMVYSDLEMVKDRDYRKLKWANNGSGNNVSFSSSPSDQGTAATSQDSYVDREYHCGCLDSCAADGGTGTTEEKKKEIDIAMQPSYGGAERVYSLTRDKNSTEYSLTVKKGSGSPSTIYDSGTNNYRSYFVRGYPENPDNEWIGISLRDSDSDYVYVMGDSTIKEWYKLANSGSVPSNMEITAAAVSNLWNQTGGLVYAYDKGAQLVYSFELTDSGTAGLIRNPGTIKFRPPISVGQALDEVGGDANKCDIFDLKADGFGSLYLGVTFPTTDTTSFNPIEHLRPIDAVHMCVLSSGDGYYKLNFILPQEYSKAVFERKYTGGSLKKIGSKVFARENYHMEVKVSQACYDELRALSYPNSRWVGIVSRYAATDPENSINGVPFNTIDFKNTHPIYSGQGCRCPGFPRLSGSNPGECKLAVINVPTPPKMEHIGTTKDSYLDICGPYESFPIYNLDENSTQQDLGLLSGKGRKDNPIDRNKLYFYMVENYPMYEIAQNPNNMADWDGDGRPGGFISSIVNPYPAGNVGGTKGTIRYEWKTWMVQSSAKDPETGNVLNTFALINETNSDDGMPYTYFYHPLGGKFIITCRVSYDWYDYDSIPFGSTKDILPTVLRNNTFARPSRSLGGYVDGDSLKSYGESSIKIDPAARLEEIMNTEGFEFMRSTGEDYSKIYTGSNGEFWAMEPLVCQPGNATDPIPIPEVALIDRCDDISVIGANQSDINSYLARESNWSGISSDGYFGLESGKAYYWRINLASQTNLFVDISKINGQTPTDRRNYNYVGDTIVKKGVKEVFGIDDETIVFENKVGDLKWASDTISVQMYLSYKEPGSDAEKILPIVYNTDPASDGMIKYQRDSINTLSVSSNDLASLWAGNKPIFASSTSGLPPTDPSVATLTIKMSRYYYCDLYKYYDEDRHFKVPAIPARVELVGAAQVRIMDTAAPTFVWSETYPNNIYGIVGTALDENTVGPSGENQRKIKFTVKDNNPWESQTAINGIDLAQHVQNYVYNFGAASFTTKFKDNKALMDVYNNFNNAGYFSGSDYYSKGVVGEILRLMRSRSKTSHLNLKPLFSREARDVRIAFETSTRNRLGKVTVDKADRNFGKDYSNYSYHNRNRFDSDHPVVEDSYIDLVGSDFEYNTFGSSNAKVKYSMDTEKIQIGDTDNRVPDGYANNTVGYRPYKFYISAVDSSGNYSGEKLLNVALHVKDDIAPIPYGTLIESKRQEKSRFPVKVDIDRDDILKEPDSKNYIVGQFYMSDGATGLMPEVLRNNDWNMSYSNNGYINNTVPTAGFYNYRAMKYVNGSGDNIVPGCNDSNFLSNISNGYSPTPVEDNVTCKFAVYVTDNCGAATATLKVKYYDSDGRNGSQNPKEKTVSSSFKQGSVVDGNDVDISSGTNNITVLFRGKEDQFPMAIPIVIQATDNAKDWDFYRGCSVDAKDDWSWDELVPGNPANNTRIFKTTLPVFGSKLNIRTIDKSIKNHVE